MKIEYRKPYCGDFLSEYYRVHDLKNIEELYSEINKRKLESPGFQFLITLDDIGQASYTSMHSKMSNGLDGGGWLKKENIDSSWYEEGYLKEDLNFDKSFYIRKLGFKHGLEKSKFEDIFEKILYLDEDSRQETIAANNNILTLIDTEMYMLKIPVQYSYESIYAFPNGYFSVDLSPFENYQLAKHMEESYGYQLFGIGSSYLAFRKNKLLSESSIDALLVLLSKLYIEESDDELINFFRDQIMNSELLVLRYSE